MAKKEAKTEPASYIDYYGDSGAVSPETYTSQHFQDYWRKQLVKKHRMAALPLTIKEKVLWKRLVHTYSAGHLLLMIDKWMENVRYNPADFVIFYSLRDEYFKAISSKDYEWD